MKLLTEFHLFPRLPSEIQGMIWGFYSRSIPAYRHEFYCSANMKGIVTLPAESRREQEEQNEETDSYALEYSSFPMVCGTLTVNQQVGRTACYPVNYEQDVFCFHSYSETESCGKLIIDWLGHYPSADMTNHDLFLARRIAFYTLASPLQPAMPTFTEHDLEILARFTRLKEFIFVVTRAERAPASILKRGNFKVRPEHQYPRFAHMTVISYLNPVECAQLWKGINPRVKVLYALDVEIPSETRIKYTAASFGFSEPVPFAGRYYGTCS
ncbi:hypothetical protein F4678DRAFT_453521 [Xylaria arbuscula]|nr:hypothetical protein F4678DRAFT_453521 [Xylaria arbuscula]